MELKMVGISARVTVTRFSFRSILENVTVVGVWGRLMRARLEEQRPVKRGS